MRAKVLALFLGVVSALAIVGGVVAANPPGQQGYEGQPGNQGNGSAGYEGQPGNQAP